MEEIRNAEGLRICPECGKPKEAKKKLFFQKEETVPIACDCVKAEEARFREREERERRERVKKDCFGYRKTLIKCGFDSYVCDSEASRDVKEKCHLYVKKFDEMKENGLGLFIFGPSGDGKTYLSAAICNALIDSRPGFRAYFTSFSEFADTMRSKYEERRDDVTDKLKTYDLVVFDDYAAERKTDYMNEKIKEAVDMRINAGLPMIVTTNMTKEELLCPKDVSEERVFSRYLGSCKFIGYVAPDYRREEQRRIQKEWEAISG